MFGPSVCALQVVMRALVVWRGPPNDILKAIIRSMFCSIEIVATNVNRRRTKVHWTDIKQWNWNLKAESAIIRCGTLPHTALSLLSPSQLPSVTGLPHPLPRRISTYSPPLQSSLIS